MSNGKSTIISCRHCGASLARTVTPAGEPVLECPRCGWTEALAAHLTPQGPDAASAPSLTQPGVFYVARPSGCTCPAGRHNRPCWHMTLARWGSAPVAPVLTRKAA